MDFYARQEAAREIVDPDGARGRWPEETRLHPRAAPALGFGLLGPVKHLRKQGEH